MTSPFTFSELQRQLTAHLQARSHLASPADLRLLAHGESNAIFRLGQHRLVRVAIHTPNQRFGGDRRRVTAFEQAILTYLQDTGIGHQLYAAHLEPTADFPYTYLMTNYLDGSALNYSRSHLQHCATTLATLHRLALQPAYSINRLPAQVPVIDRPLTLFYQEAQTYAQPYLDSPTADPDIVEMLHALLAKAADRLGLEAWIDRYPHRCLVHSDHTYENWVITPDRAHLIDWEWAEIGSPAGDLGHFLSPVTICRYQGYQLPIADRDFFLRCYYDALADTELATRIQYHFAAFGAFPAVRSLCWTAGYWTTTRWYAEANSPSAIERQARLQQSRQQFPVLWQAVMDWLEAEQGA